MIWNEILKVGIDTCTPLSPFVSNKADYDIVIAYKQTPVNILL